MLLTSERSEYHRAGGKRNRSRQWKTPQSKVIVERLLAEADVAIGGERPWDLQVKNPAFFRRLLAGGSLALGESFMDGWWDCGQLDGFVHKILRADLKSKITSWKDRLGVMQAMLMNKQNRGRAFQVGKRHYDMGNDLY